MILSQDLTFSRVLNRLFNDLKSSVDRVRGSKYFKGVMMMAVRDVESAEGAKATEELKRNMSELIQRGFYIFLKKLFNGRLWFHPLNTFTCLLYTSPSPRDQA
eukprot:TRINITY_DN24026_c0_g1_i1.p2 TRINITY_DN24026_c0_g1~~TRINITY_DN24026_c0_g1_i1.p2  ORF type:complete len:103 (-),score=9.24 TRINITY_DN24026_c0_g1_i1:33-341(-)